MGITRCVNHRTDYVPNVEARSCTSYRSGQTGLILSVCAVHAKKGTASSLIFSGNTVITASSINLFINEVNAELTRRGLGVSGIDYVYVGNLAYSDIISKLSEAILKMKDNYTRVDFSPITSKGVPSSGGIMYAIDPNTPHNVLNALMQECVCYTDCGGYSLCSCHGYCSHY